MLIKEIPYHLRHTLTEVKAPIYMERTDGGWRAGAELDLQLTLWLLGFVENLGRETDLFASGGHDGLLRAHELVRELKSRSQVEGLVSAGLVHPRPTHSFLLSSHYYTKSLPVLPFGSARVSPAGANLGFYGLPLVSDRPAFPRALIKNHLADDLLSSQKECSIMFPWGFRGGVERWWDSIWWNTLAHRLRERGPVIVLGPPEMSRAIGQSDRFHALEPRFADQDYLGELAGLFAGAWALAGRRGELGCMASALGNRVVLIWDSLLSYRHWSSAGPAHVVLANPYGLRYPQTMRKDPRDLWAAYLTVEGKDPSAAGSAPPEQGPEWQRFESFCRNKEQAELALKELHNLQDWLGKKELRELFYAKSLDYASGYLVKNDKATGAWLAPVAP